MSTAPTFDEFLTEFMASKQRVQAAERWDDRARFQGQDLRVDTSSTVIEKRWETWIEGSPSSADGVIVCCRNAREAEVAHRAVLATIAWLEDHCTLKSCPEAAAHHDGQPDSGDAPIELALLSYPHAADLGDPAGRTGQTEDV